MQPKREHLTVLHLDRWEADVWLPCIERMVRHARQTKSVRCPLFPGYFFINLGLETARCRTINVTVGVKNIVSCGRAPSVVNPEFITALMASENSDGFDDACDANLKPGQDVEILSGLMAGQSGKLLSLDAANR